jgi:hypothetical protein
MVFVVKTVRFSQVVARSGAPETHLAFVEPSKDRALQAALKAQRVMTVKQETVGTRTDRGEIGLNPGPHRQYLIFPKSLRTFPGRAVVGIKYDLLSSPEVPKRERATRTRSARKAVAMPKAARTRPKKKAPPAMRKVVAFKPAPADDDEVEKIAELKRQVRRAMAALEEGKAVAAFNLLKSIVGG